jgi:hypothetical protein
MKIFEYVNTGIFPGDETADTLRDGFDKINSNFQLISDSMDVVEFSGCASDIRRCFEIINKNFKEIGG